MKKIAFITNLRHESTREYAEKLYAWLTQRQFIAYALVREENADQELSIPSEESLAKDTDLVIALGGDGTLLSAARIAAPCGIPILGVNMGNLGFLMEVEISHLYDSLEQVFRGDYTEDHRMMLHAEVIREGRCIRELTGLNDVVVHKGALSRLLGINFWMENEFVGNCKGDGVIIASPTGSTAYSLSAGGPVVHPSLEVMIQTWICPHTITARPTVIPPDKQCIIELEDMSSEVLLTVDGQASQTLQEKDRIIVKKAPFKTIFIRLAPLKLFSLIKTKLVTQSPEIII
ncbi:MAG: NAD(+)/NADH kinase [Peptococcaceae bacterium]|jgi:NAD+ kinase|nr:NAD(+)/NADH kinase [Peptococcaceae bacterium]